VKAKLLAAHRAGIKTFILPEKNRKDLVDIPQEVLDAIDIKPVSTIEEVLKLALLPGGPSVTPAQIEAARPAMVPPAN
jgi:ATP-dependent Lon protease